MKKILLILFALPTLAFGQIDYGDDVNWDFKKDSSKTYIKTYSLKDTLSNQKVDLIFSNNIVQLIRYDYNSNDGVLETYSITVSRMDFDQYGDPLYTEYNLANGGNIYLKMPAEITIEKGVTRYYQYLK